MTPKPTVEAFKTYFFDLPMATANEALRFAAHRLEEPAKLASAVSSCKTPFELAEIQSAFVRSTINDYQKKAAMFVHQAQNRAIRSHIQPNRPCEDSQFVCPRNCFRPHAISISLVQRARRRIGKT